MIRVVCNWQELGEAVLALQREGLPLPKLRKTNLIILLRQALARVEKGAAIVDLWCGRGVTLKFLHRCAFPTSAASIWYWIRMPGRHRSESCSASAPSGRPTTLHAVTSRARRYHPPHRMPRLAFRRSSTASMSSGFSPRQRGSLAGRTAVCYYRLLGGQDRHSSCLRSRLSVADLFSRADHCAGESCPAIRTEGRRNDDVPACEDKPVSWQGRCYTFAAMLSKKCESRR
jgi:hypothetical protein